MNQKRSTQISRPQSSRQWAFALFENWQENGRLIRDQIQAIQGSQREVDTRNLRQGRHLAERLITRMRTVDVIMQSLIKRPRDQVEKPLWRILQLGTCELLFSSYDEPYAIISETVELCRWLKQPRWTGFANGVLRNVQRMMTEETASLPGTHHLPISWGNYLVLNQEPFPDPEHQAEDYYGTAFSLPRAIVHAWNQQYGSDKQDQLLDLCFSTLSEPPLTIRLSPQINREDWMETLKEQNVESEALNTPRAVRLNQSVELAKLPGWEEGQFAVQDETAMQAVLLMELQPEEIVLDLCAGRGTKAIQMAEEMGGRGTVYVSDYSEKRMEEAEQAIERSGWQNLSMLPYQQIQEDTVPQKFDAILVDAPCSNTGVLGKRPEARWRYSQQTLHELNDIQMELLDLAAGLVKPNGRMIYSTCSIERKENEQLVQRWLETHSEFQPGSTVTKLPNSQSDGGFAIVLLRKP